MGEINPLMAMLLASNDFLGSAEAVENEIEQLPEQLDFTVGDCAILASGSAAVEHDFALVKMLDAAEHADQYPDWEERLLNSFVLCEHFSKYDPEITIGWFNRLKLIKIDPEHYQEAQAWMQDWPEQDIPEWVNEAHYRYTDQLHERAPSIVPKAVECPSCHSRRVMLKVIRSMTYTAHCGIILRKEDEKEVYRSLGEPEIGSSHSVRLICTDCHAMAVIDDDEEWEIPGYTN